MSTKNSEEKNRDFDFDLIWQKFGFILPILAPLTGYIAKLILDYSIYAIYFFANVTGAQFSLNISPYGVVVSYFCLVIACLYLNKRTKNSFTQSNVVI